MMRRKVDVDLALIQSRPMQVDLPASALSPAELVSND
jgi:hypothetical protein